MIEHICFNSDVDGPHLIVLGAIHGDETCGPIAIKKVIQKFEGKESSLLKGKVTFVPVCNADAYAQGVRFVEENLNRIICKHETPKNNEQHFANDVCDLISSADVMLDLHSFEAEGDPMVFLDHPEAEVQGLAEVLGGKVILYGWDNIYEGEAISSECTESWAYKNCVKGLTFECGKNGTEESNVVAYEAILRTLSFYSMIEVDIDPAQTKPHHIEMDKVVLKEKDGTFAESFKDVVELKKDTLISIYNDGTEIRMPYDGFLILPAANAPVGQEWFYLGQER